jgi:hypothetical protein
MSYSFLEATQCQITEMEVFVQIELSMIDLFECLVSF